MNYEVSTNAAGETIVIILDDNIDIQYPNIIHRLVLGDYKGEWNNYELPSSLVSLEFGINSNQKIHNICWPMNLHTIHFGDRFNQ
jgi:hypothetical protein